MYEYLNQALALQRGLDSLREASAARRRRELRRRKASQSFRRRT
jgi:hypothetical protein